MPRFYAAESLPRSPRIRSVRSKIMRNEQAKRQIFYLPSAVRFVRLSQDLGGGHCFRGDPRKVSKCTRHFQSDWTLNRPRTKPGVLFSRCECFQTWTKPLKSEIRLQGLLKLCIRSQVPKLLLAALQGGWMCHLGSGSAWWFLAPAAPALLPITRIAVKPS